MSVLDVMEIIFDSVYLYAMANGVMKESDYPYKGVDGVCKYDKK